MNFSNRRVLDQYLALGDKPFLLQYFEGVSDSYLTYEPRLRSLNMQYSIS